MSFFDSLSDNFSDYVATCAVSVVYCKAVCVHVVFAVVFLRFSLSLSTWYIYILYIVLPYMITEAYLRCNHGFMNAHSVFMLM